MKKMSQKVHVDCFEICRSHLFYAKLLTFLSSLLLCRQYLQMCSSALCVYYWCANISSAVQSKSITLWTYLDCSYLSWDPGDLDHLHVDVNDNKTTCWCFQQLCLLKLKRDILIKFNNSSWALFTLLFPYTHIYRHFYFHVNFCNLGQSFSNTCISCFIENELLCFLGGW